MSVVCLVHSNTYVAKRLQCSVRKWRTIKYKFSEAGVWQPARDESIVAMWRRASSWIVIFLEAHVIVYLYVEGMKMEESALFILSCVNPHLFHRKILCHKQLRKTQKETTRMQSHCTVMPLPSLCLPFTVRTCRPFTS